MTLTWELLLARKSLNVHVIFALLSAKVVVNYFQLSAKVVVNCGVTWAPNSRDGNARMCSLSPYAGLWHVGDLHRDGSDACDVNVGVDSGNGSGGGGGGHGGGGGGGGGDTEVRRTFIQIAEQVVLLLLKHRRVQNVSDYATARGQSGVECTLHAPGRHPPLVLSGWPRWHHTPVVERTSGHVHALHLSLCVPRHVCASDCTPVCACVFDWGCVWFLLSRVAWQSPHATREQVHRTTLPLRSAKLRGEPSLVVSVMS